MTRMGSARGSTLTGWRRAGRRRGVAAGLLLVAAFACLSRVSVQGEEPVDRFIEALHEHGLVDMLQDYLERMETSPLAPVSLKETILYERARALLELATEQRDMAIREKTLDAAQEFIDQFIRQRAGHPLADVARSELGAIKLRRAEMKLEIARSAKGVDSAPKLKSEAAALYTDAATIFKEAENAFREKIKAYPKVLQQGTPEYEQRERLKPKMLQSMLLGGVIKEQLADTLEPRSPQWTETLNGAAQDYRNIYDKYRTLIVGMYARMYEGRVQQKLGQHAQALSYFVELLDNPTLEEPLRVLHTKVLVLAMDSWLDESQKKYAEAIQQVGPWVEKIRPNEESDPDWLKLRYRLAFAHRGFGEFLKTQNPKDPQARRSLDEARKQATVVGKYVGDLQDPARRMVAELGGRKYTETAASSEPTTFKDALDAGKEALENAQTSQKIIEILPGRIQAETNAEAKADLEKQLKEAQESIVAANHDARRLLELALELADGDTAVEDLNTARYLLSYLHVIQNEFYEAAVLGEFVARRYPDAASARSSARFAMISYAQLLRQNTTATKEFETARVVSICEHIARSWPNQPEGAEALGTLIQVVINRGELERARQVLAQIPAESPARAAAEMQTGMAICASVWKKSAEIEKAEQAAGGTNADEASARAQLVSMRKDAQQLLEQGIGRAKETPIDAVRARAIWYLASVSLETDQPELTVQLLENAQTGPLTLLRGGNPVITATPGLDWDIYKTALRGYLGVLAKAVGGQESMEKVKAVIAELNRSSGSTPDGQKRLVGFYVALARDLKQQMDSLADAGAKQKLAAAFEEVARQVGEGSRDLTVLNGLATTLTSMGDALAAGGQSPAEAERFHTRAIEIYERMLQMGPDGKAGLDPAIETQLRMQMAIAHRQMKKFTKATEIFESLLAKNESTIHLQIEAARTYQLWAMAPGKEGLYERAIHGAKPNPKTKRNVIWGWLRIGQMTSHNPKYRDTFFEARYAAASCYFQHALAKPKGSDEQKKLATSAKAVLVQTCNLYELSDTWEPQYDLFLKRVQQTLGEPADGVRGIKKPAKKANTTAAK